MVGIQITAKDYNPNILILQKYIITINKNLITLYDLNGSKLDKIEIEFGIIEKFDNLYKIDKYHFILSTDDFWYNININN